MSKLNQNKQKIITLYTSEDESLNEDAIEKYNLECGYTPFDYLDNE